MLLVNGKGTETDNRASKLPFEINSCGVNINDPVYRPMEAGFEIYRPKGRLDYQILYMWVGEADYLVNDVYYTLRPGDVLLYRPGDVQRYAYSANKPVECRWIHFTGTSVEQMLKRFGVFPQPAMSVGLAASVKSLFERMADELDQRPAHHAEMCAAMFTALLIEIARRAKPLKREGARKQPRRVDTALSNMLAFMNQRYAEPYAVADYAAQCGLSVHYFIGVFKEFTGFSPYAYLTLLRIDHAKELLRGSGASIADVARMCGWDNPLYFSRVFARKTGVSPSVYRDSPELWSKSDLRGAPCAAPAEEPRDADEHN